MGRRYLRRFRCVDCGEPTEKMWETPRPLICNPCAAIRIEVAYVGARAAVAEHTRQCRIRLQALRQAPALTLEGTASAVPERPTGVSRRDTVAS